MVMHSATSQNATDPSGDDPQSASQVAIDSIVSDIARRYFDLGWDFGSFSGINLPDGAPSEMKQGWEQARQRLTQRAPTRFERKWLSLRGNALRRNRVVDPAVTPSYIEEIKTGHCPVLGTPLTCATGGDMDWSIDRVYNDGAYAPSNLCVMSAKANKAKGCKMLGDVLVMADEARRSGQAAGGLTEREWRRMAAVMVGPHVLVTNEIHLLPQATFIPRDLAITTEQLLQQAVMFDALGEASGKVIGRLRAHCHAKAERLLHKLVQALRRKDGRSPWIYDVWLEAGVFDRFREWYTSLSGYDQRLVCDLAQKIEYKKTLTLAKHEIGGWALPTGGYAVRP